MLLSPIGLFHEPMELGGQPLLLDRITLAVIRPVAFGLRNLLVGHRDRMPARMVGIDDPFHRPRIRLVHR